LRQYGYSRDKRGDCRQVVIALIVTPEGFPLSYEVLSGDTADSTTLSEFLERIERHYGCANEAAAPLRRTSEGAARPDPTAGASTTSLEFRLDRQRLRQVRRREGRYLLRTNLTANEPAALWTFYIQLTEVEQAFNVMLMRSTLSESEARATPMTAQIQPAYSGLAWSTANGFGSGTGRPSSITVSSQSSMASRALTIASSSVSPAE
jgi:hypothetical protein